jgi:multiple sugar transport system ATP-binding protein
MVFQHYALYPHMTARQNMAFGLKNARIPADEIDRRIAEAAHVLEIEPLLERKPAQMSGGQRQRVAIGRALVKEPKLFLLDEPLSNLDAALRLRTRVELAQLKQRVDAAVIMVTHDQAEAMTLADRIVVMNDRRIQQVGPPMEIYSRPANQFVAQFVGSPAMTLAPASLVGGEGEFAALRLGDGSLLVTRVPKSRLPSSGELRAGIRPEAVRVDPNGDTEAKVELVERLGERTLIYARLCNGQAITAEDTGDSAVRIGNEILLRIDGAAAHIFDSNGVGYHRAAA